MSDDRAVERTSRGPSEQVLSGPDILIASLRGLQTYFDLNPECIPAAEQPIRTPGEAADEIERLREMVVEVAGSGVAFEDERIDYVEVQIDRSTWDALRAERDKTLPTADDVRGILG